MYIKVSVSSDFHTKFATVDWLALQCDIPLTSNNVLILLYYMISVERTHLYFLGLREVILRYLDGLTTPDFPRVDMEGDVFPRWLPLPPILGLLGGMMTSWRWAEVGSTIHRSSRRRWVIGSRRKFPNLVSGHWNNRCYPLNLTNFLLCVNDLFVRWILLWLTKAVEDSLQKWIFRDR